MKKLEGDAAWLDGIDATKTDIELRSRITPSRRAEVLLRSGNDVLVSRREYDDSQLIVVANGSFLLNLPLVNHEHRKLAGKLIDADRAAGQDRRVSGELRRRAADPRRRSRRGGASTAGNLQPSGRPIGSCCIWPPSASSSASRAGRFSAGRKTCETASDSDFGRHVDALADLLKRSRDRAYAMERILNYRQRAERDK